MAWPIPNPGSSVCSPFIATGNLPGSSSPAADESSSSAVVVCHSAITSSPNHHQAPYPPQPNLAPFPALYLYPIDDSFVPRRVALGGGQRVKIGRRTNAKAQPGETNGYFFSRVLSRQHAEVWEQGGRIFIQDVKSANGTFINGERLSLDGHESEPHELKSDDILEFGVDVVGEDNKTVMHHKVVARVACVFPDKDGNVETPPVWPDTQPEVDAPTNATAGDEDAKPKDKAEARYACTCSVVPPKFS
ncbi:SMAD/FHA domain-containing protein [Mycena galopus ATCC 62051]|nr:SMAD/FHA domain-containing protein [Mycena galopus ATCC 62051]